MTSISRRKTRQALLRALYIDVQNTDPADIDLYVRFFEETGDFLDKEYFLYLRTGIPTKQKNILSIIAHYGPRFDIHSLPIVNLLILSISIYEMLYFSEDNIPENVSINEALELTKKFSDTNAKNFINGVLNAVKRDKKSLLDDSLEVKKVEMKLFNS